MLETASAKLRYMTMQRHVIDGLHAFFLGRFSMVVPKIAVCPICGKRTYLRIEDGGYLKEYPIRFNCINCRALIKGTYNMSMPGQRGLILYNADVEECDVDPQAGIIKNADYVIEISGELPCSKVRKFDGKLIYSTPFMEAAQKTDMLRRKERLSYFVKNIEEWKAWRSIAFQLLDEGSTEYLSNALKNRMGDYPYQCDNYLKSLHCLQEVVQEETKYLFYPETEDEKLTDLIGTLAKIDRSELHCFVEKKGGVDTLISDYRKIIDVFSSFMDIYPNILPAETYMRFSEKSTDLGIATCSFEDLKAYYQDSYEALVSLLYIPVCLDNIILRNKYDKFSEQIAAFVNSLGYRGIKGTDYARYTGLDNGKKLEFVDSSEPIQKELEIPANKDLRNGIGHNNYKYDGITQIITTYDLRKKGKIKLQRSLMNIALDCIGLAKASVIMGEIVLFILRQEMRSENMHSALHPRFYSKVEVNDRCPCGSGIKYKQCCRRDVDAMKSSARVKK